MSRRSSLCQWALHGRAEATFIPRGTGQPSAGGRTPGPAGSEALLWIQALVATSVAEIPAELIEDAATDDPIIGFALAAQLQDLIIDGMEALSLAASASFRARLAYHLLKLATASGQGAELPIAQRDLADVVWSAREVVSRALRSLRDDGLVRTETGLIRIEDRAGLESVARGGGPDPDKWVGRGGVPTG